MRDVLRRLAAAWDDARATLRRACRHVFDADRCEPPACTRCGATSRVTRD